MDALYEVNENEAIDAEDAKSEDVAANGDIEAEASAPYRDEPSEPVTDYEALIASDVAALKSEFPELKGISDITELHNPLRYAALRDLGLSPAEAYMATAKRRTQDTRSHLRSAHGRSAASQTGMMSQFELATARELFPDMNDSELQRLYKRVTK